MEVQPESHIFCNFPSLKPDFSFTPRADLIIFKSVMTAIEQIKQGIETIIGEEELVERMKAGKKLRVKLGVDPTRPDLTFGHMVVLNKLRQFQDLGHEAILIIGDYTAMIGDPSGRSATRPPLSAKEAKENAKTYLDQAFKVLDKKNTTVRYNSEWFSKMSFEDSLNLSRKMTVARMLERDDFSKRYAENAPISIVEFLYPLVQGYDSIMVESDVELGGNDQLFNNLVGRRLLEDAGKPPQAVITLPLLVGLDGVRKMSKSLDNYIAFSDSPKDMFGRIMSVSDALMWDYYKLLLLKTDAEIKKLKEEHPMEVKKLLAYTLTAKFHSKEAAEKERSQFEQVFSKQQLPDDMPSFTWSEIAPEGKTSLIDAINQTGLLGSKSEIRRLIQQGGVKLEGEKITDPFYPLPKPDSKPITIQAGKRTFFQLTS